VYVCVVCGVYVWCVCVCVGVYVCVCGCVCMCVCVCLCKQGFIDLEIVQRRCIHKKEFSSV